MILRRHSAILREFKFAAIDKLSSKVLENLVDVITQWLAAIDSNHWEEESPEAIRVSISPVLSQGEEVDAGKF